MSSTAHQFSNFFVSYIDLLGQRDAMKGQQLLPENDDDLIATIRGSIRSIVVLQRQAQQFVQGSKGNEPERLEQVPPELREKYRDLVSSSYRIQRWSDGLMIYAPLGDSGSACPTNDALEIIVLSGALCLLGLSSRTPLRGGIDLAWAVELHENELYGPAVARAYELENFTAQYPRIVVGQHFFEYLEHESVAPGNSIADQHRRRVAERCLEIIKPDFDGQLIVDYLGEAFSSRVQFEGSSDVIERSKQFILDEIARHKSAKDTKLSLRYLALANYFGVQIEP